jgi:UDP-2,3-diacylglucosamine hydrolase
MPRPIHRLVVMSDAHLGAVPPEVENVFLEFLDQVPSLGDGLLINGDLFGFWFAYRRAIPRAGIRAVARLAALARRIPVLMTGGNHDRWGAPFWSELGIQFEAFELRFALGDTPALALHGDRIPGVSLGSRLKARVFTSSIASLGFRMLPADLGFRLTAPLAAPSRSARAQAHEEATAARQLEWATAELRNGSAAGLIILGHSHRPAAVELEPGRRYLNPGAWFDGYRYALVTEEAVELTRHSGS